MDKGFYSSKSFSDEKTPTSKIYECLDIVKDMAKDCRFNQMLSHISEESEASYGQHGENPNFSRPASSMGQHMNLPNNRILRSSSVRVGRSGRIRTNSAMKTLVTKVSSGQAVRNPNLEPGVYNRAPPMYGPAGSGLSASGLAWTDSDYGMASSSSGIAMRGSYGYSQSGSQPSSSGQSGGGSLGAPGLAFPSPVKSTSTAFRLTSPSKSARRSISKRRSSERKPSVVAAVGSSSEDD